MARVGLEGGWVRGGFGVHHRAVAKLPKHCANLVVGWLVGGGGASAAAAAADAMRVCIIIRDQQEHTMGGGGSRRFTVMSLNSTAMLSSCPPTLAAWGRLGLQKLLFDKKSATASPSCHPHHRPQDA